MDNNTLPEKQTDELLEEILASIDKLKNQMPISNIGLRMPGLNTAKRETTKILARELYLRLNGRDIGPDAPVEDRQLTYIHYTKLRSMLKKNYVEQATAKNIAEKAPASCKLTPWHQARYSQDLYNQAKNLPLSTKILYPTAMPVEVSKYNDLKDFFDRLQNATSAAADNVCNLGSYEEFKRGAYYTDGRIDLCKQVVGPNHIQTLMNSILMNPNIIHFLLGNNIIGLVGAAAIANFINHPTKLCNIQTWYLAGNDINAAGITLIANALSHDTHCKDLWLKRNPIGVNGAYALAKMLETNKTIETLDLDNTAIGDEGCCEIFNSLIKNKTLKTIYLDANGLTIRSIRAITEYFYHMRGTGSLGITHLSIGMNRLENIGAIELSRVLTNSKYPLQSLILSSNRIELEGLKHILAYATISPSLRVLDIGYYKATADMGELPNSFGDVGARHIASFIMLNTPLRYLGFHNTHITDISQIKSAMEHNTNLYMVSPEQYMVSCANLYKYCWRNSGLSVEEHKQMVRKLKHGDNIWVIDSIYRNKM